MTDQQKFDEGEAIEAHYAGTVPEADCFICQQEAQQQEAAAAICKEKGHDFSGDGYQSVATTETASESFTCNRCGFENDVTYY